MKKKRFEFSKVILVAVMLTYFWGLGISTYIVWHDSNQLGYFLTFIGTPTATAIGFYAWKAKAENIKKLGLPLDDIQDNQSEGGIQ